MSNTPIYSDAALWVAEGASIVDEAARSAASLARHMPGLPRILATPDKDRPAGFDRIIPLKPDASPHVLLRHVAYIHQAFGQLDCERAIYLDTDVYICDALDGLFELLSYYDLAGCHSPRRFDPARMVYPIPETFTELNLGVLAFQVNLLVTGLFDNWLALSRAHAELYGNDAQSPLRDAMWDWTGRVCVLPTEWNFRFMWGGQVNGRVRILHGRSDDIQQVERTVNAKPAKIRAWRRGELF